MLKIINVKETLADGLIRLTQRKDISKITVQDIVNECHTSRRTFYNHFQDKYDLINWIYASKTEEILNSFKESKTWLECLIDMYNVFKSEKLFFVNISSFMGQNSFNDFLYEYTRNYLVTYITTNYGNEIMTDEFMYSIEYHCYGLENMGIQWIKRGMPVAPEVIAQWHYNNLPLMMKKYME